MGWTMDVSPAGAGSAYVPRTDELRHDLFKIDYLLTTLAGASGSAAAQVYDIVWLKDRRRFLRGVLAERRALQQEKIVDLAAWRRTGTTRQASLADVA